MRSLIVLPLVMHIFALQLSAQPVPVKITGAPEKWTLLRGNQPYFIKGVGGEASWEMLAKLGGNSVRTWGHEKLSAQLDLAEKLGLTVTAGIWLGQVRQGFNWADAKSLIKQRETIRQTVLKHKDHPALLFWSLGNEMEDANGDNGAVWSEINNLARLVKSIDPNHPTMTVIAEMGGNKIQNIHALCPDIDIIGINSYAGAATVGERYQKLGGTKPYVLSEFGPPGIWEIKKDDAGAFREPTSTAKADFYRAAYSKSVLGQKGICLGSYAFMWGQKQEVTATWFSMLLKDGSRLAAVDTLSELWTGKMVPNRCPTIESMTLIGNPSNKPGTNIQISLKTHDPENDPIQVVWEIFSDEEEYGTGGDAEAAAMGIANSIVQANDNGALVRLPKDGGLYRVFATVRDNKGGAAIANIPFRVEAPLKTAMGKPVRLPLVIYSEAESTSAYIPSGWMGDAKSIKVDPHSTEKPYSGKVCMRCEFNAENGWGGVAWQNPEQDWGDKKGGFNLSGAKKLSFHARGAQGGEEVSFGFGLIGSEKRYYDTAKRTTGKIRLGKDWQKYQINLNDLKANENLERIKVGFVWTVASTGKPTVFYLDDIQWE